jgi:hypothetical protein
MAAHLQSILFGDRGAVDFGTHQDGLLPSFALLVGAGVALGGGTAHEERVIGRHMSSMPNANAV